MARVSFFSKILLIIGVVFLLNYGSIWLFNKINFQLWPHNEPLTTYVLLASFGTYVLWMALPFMPGIEVGLALMIMLGPKGIVLVYIGTILSLSLSFMIGRLIPHSSIVKLLGWLHLHKAKNLVVQLHPLPPEQKLNFLLTAAPLKIIPLVLKNRYLAIAIVFNIPGNTLIGGGGGIGLIAGMSRLYSFPKYILSVSIAIMPLPLIFLARSIA